MKKELLPDFAKPFKTKGFDVRLVSGKYQLYKISSKRVPDKSYPVLIQTYVGTITEEGKLLPKKVSTEELSNTVEFGLSNFILKQFYDELTHTFFNNAGSIQTIYRGIVLYMYGYYSQRFIDLTYLRSSIDKDAEDIYQEGFTKRVITISNKISKLLTNLIPDDEDRCFLIQALKDIKINANAIKPMASYSEDLTILFDKYGIKYE